MVKRNKKIWFVTLVLSFMAVLSLVTSGYTEEAVARKIKIGVIGPMKFSAGQQNWWGAEMAADEINKAGGITINRVKYGIELVKADDNGISSITDTVTAMERLITVDKVNFVTGGYMSEETMALQEVAAKHRMILMGGGGIIELGERVAKDYDKYKYYFRAMHENNAIIGKNMLINLELAGLKLKTELGIDKVKVAILMDKLKIADEISEMAKDTIPKLGMELVGVWRTSPTTSDYSSELTAIRGTGAHVIFVFFPGPSGVVFSRQWGELKIPALVVGFNNEALLKRHWEDTRGMCEYELLNGAFPRVEVTNKTMPFYNKFIAKTGQYPSSMAGTYHVIYLLKEAAERANTIETETMVAAIEKTDYIRASW